MKYLITLTLLALVTVPAFSAQRPDIEIHVVRDCAPGVSRLREPLSGRELCIDPRAIVGGGRVRTVTMASSPTDEGLEVELDPAGTAVFREFTGANFGHQIAILIDGTLVCAPWVHDAIKTGWFQLCGLSHAQALQLVERFKASP